MTLGRLMVPLCNAEEAGWGAVAALALMTITAWTVEVVKTVLVSTPAFAADHQVFMSAASFDGVSQTKAAGTL